MTQTNIERALRVRAGNLYALAKAITLAAGALLMVSQPGQAAQPNSLAPGATIVVRWDEGGSVRKRYNEIQAINRLGQKVEVRGGVCLSSCTMYLGAKNVCVTASSRFGFHGPYRFGAKLTQQEFDEWSRVIAVHYPPAVKAWYMEKARHQIWKATYLSGAELIRLGIPRCKS